MARTAELYRLRRAQGLCGDCGADSPTRSRCVDCMDRHRDQRAKHEEPLWLAAYAASCLPAYAGDRRTGASKRYAGQQTRALGWALVQHRARFEAA